MDQLDKIYETSKYLLPWSTFLIGFLGSLHCAGMCGGLVMACGNKPTHNALYQVGRLTSYSLLAIISGFAGRFLTVGDVSPTFSLLVALSLGAFLIFLGVKLILKNNSSIKPPKFFTSLSFRLFSKVLPKKNGKNNPMSSYLIGSFSILLPCGFLYGVILALATYRSPLLSLICIITFWIGTLPIMALAPGLIKKLLRPIYLKMPMITSSFLIVIGLMTIANRALALYQTTQGHSCH